MGGREQRLVQLIQLMKDLCSESSCLPLSACKFPVCLISPLSAMSSERAGEWKQSKKRQGEKQISRYTLLQLDVGLVLFLLFKPVVVVWLDHGLIINPETTQIQIAVFT